MPVNRNALIRYRTIDKCLQNRRRKWTIENLMDACSDALYEYEGIDKPISLRTIRLDLNAMRSDKLGYSAPIVVVEKKYYTYEDPEFTITDIPLTSQDLGVLQEISQLLRQFKGFSHFKEMNEMLHKLEDKIYTEQHQQRSVIDFEKNELLTGIEWLDVLHKAIIQQQTIQLRYQSFKARQAADIIMYPYLLKEYRNRWFLLAMNRKGKEIATFALDRMQDVTLLPGEPFKIHRSFNPQIYFNDIIGVTRNIGDSPVDIIFHANNIQAPYIKTKPIHHSQKIIDQQKEGTTFSITVIPNFELERELIGFGEGLTVLAPNRFVRRIKHKVQLLYNNYFTTTT